MFPVVHLIHRELSKTSLYISLSSIKKLHALMISAHLSQDPFYVTQIVRLYGISGQLCNARRTFEKSPSRSIFLWNAIIRAYAQAHKFSDAFYLFTMMLRTDIKPDNFTYACLARAFSEGLDVHGLKLVHATAVVSGFGQDSICSSALVTAYSKLSLVDEASKVFGGIMRPDLVLWNTIISAYGNCEFGYKSLLLYNTMLRMGTKPDGYTLVGLLLGIADSSLVNIGQCIHGFCLKTGFDSNDYVASALVRMYSKCNSLDSLHKVFGEIEEPDLVTWSSLITGYAQSGEHKNALFFFKKLIFSGIKPDSILIASILALTSQMANVKHGTEIHAYVLRQGLDSNVMVCSSLIDMYSKSGSLVLGIRVFEIMPQRNIVSYNALILGFGIYGLASQAFHMFEEILDKGLVPDESTFSALLCACCHSGLVEEGRNIFRRMREFSVQTRIEHYVHLVKLLGMNGGLEEAYYLIQSLPPPVDHGIWGALLSCCHACGNFKLAEIVAQRLIENNTNKGSYRVMLSNIYACDGRWDEAVKVRDTMREDSMFKTPGISYIDDNNINPFVTSNALQEVVLA